MKKYTKYLFYIGVFLSLSSLVYIESGGREIYPFFSWKLFSIPCGSNEYETESRIYGIKNNDTIRLSFSDNEELFTANEKVKVIHYYTKRFQLHIDTKEDIQDLQKYGKLMNKDCETFLLVEEKYKPQDLSLGMEKAYPVKTKIIKVLE